MEKTQNLDTNFETLYKSLVATKKSLATYSYNDKKAFLISQVKKIINDFFDLRYCFPQLTIGNGTFSISEFSDDEAGREDFFDVFVGILKIKFPK